jgi:hypothetical protein
MVLHISKNTFIKIVRLLVAFSTYLKDLYSPK